MLTIKCSKCKSKLFKYKKIGEGKVLRCWKEKITRVYEGTRSKGKLICGSCGNKIAEEKEDYYKMKKDQFTFTGTKDSS